MATSAQGNEKSTNKVDPKHFEYDEAVRLALLECANLESRNNVEINMCMDGQNDEDYVDMCMDCQSDEDCEDIRPANCRRGPCDAHHECQGCGCEEDHAGHYVYAEDQILNGPDLQWEIMKHARIQGYQPVEERYMTTAQKTQAMLRRRASV